MAEVLGNDDLLHEILLRLGFPICLVRAAAVCRRWLRLASDPSFLRRFRKLHPLHLLGFYLVTYCNRPFPRFVPLPLPLHPELAAVIRRGSFELGQEAVSDCRGGHLVLSLNGGFGVRSPLQPGRGTIALPKLLPPAVQGSGSDSVYSRDVFLTESDADGSSMSYIAVTLMCSGLRLKVRISRLQGEAWCDGRSFDLIELPQRRARWNKLGLIAGGKLYIVCAAGYIVGIDLPSLSLFYIKLPEAVGEHANQANIKLSLADGCGFYLIYAKGFQIRIWHYSISNGDWKLVDVFCLLRQLGHLADPSWPPGFLFMWMRLETMPNLCSCGFTLKSSTCVRVQGQSRRYMT